MILKIKNFWWILTHIHVLAMASNSKNALKLIEDIFKFAKQTAEEGRPRLCKIALINVGDENKMQDFVTLWAGAHDGNPLERIETLVHQRDALKEVIKNFIDKFPEEEKNKYNSLIDFMI